MTKLYALVDGGQVSNLYVLSLPPPHAIFFFPLILFHLDYNSLSPVKYWHARPAQGFVF